MVTTKNNFLVLRRVRVLKNGLVTMSNTLPTARSLSSPCFLNTRAWVVGHPFPGDPPCYLSSLVFVFLVDFSAGIPASLAPDPPGFWHSKCQWPHLPPSKHPDEKKIPVNHLDLLFTRRQTSGWLNTFISVRTCSLSVWYTLIFQIHQRVAVV